MNKMARICIMGAGMSGMLMAIKLLKAGYTDFVIYEKAAKVGGTWRENRYPGVACDVASFSYCYDFEFNPDWSHRFSPGGEIQAYFERVALKYGLHQYIRFSTEITQANYVDNIWRIESNHRDVDCFDFFIAASGPLNNKKYPDIKGLSSFEGKAFHTADWDDNYDINGKRIAVIGTGSSAVQSIAPLAELASHLTLFQRTPQWVMGSPNPAYSAFSKKIKQLFPFLGEMTRRFYLWVGDEFGKAALRDGLRRRFIQWACEQNLKTVKDDALRKKLTPTDQAMCKRMIMSDTYYPAVQRNNVALVTDAIDYIEPRGVVTQDGRLHEVDLLVLATGFYPNVWGVKGISGINGQTLESIWQQGVRTYQSITMLNMPNYFMLIGPNSPITNLSLIEIADIGVDYAIQCIEAFNAGRFTALMPKQDVTDQFNQTLQNSFADTVWVSGCNSWYLDADGIPATWPWSPSHYRKSLKIVRWDDYDFIK